jgi:2-oxoglutarate dehydrogenase E1 component
VYYDLLEEREKRNINNISLVRVEQIYPFPHRTLKRVLEERPDAEVVWCQEEPKNMGSWFFLDRRLEDVMTEVGGKFHRPHYVGRPEASSPATGSLARHNEEQNKLVSEALDLKKSMDRAAE